MKSIFKIIICCFTLIFLFGFVNICSAYWTWPVDGRELQNIHGDFTSEFGPNAYSETEYRFHDGIDIDTANNQEIYSSIYGTVDFVGQDGPYGLTIRISNYLGSNVRYCHMNDAYVMGGSSVEPGDMIGHSGESSRGTHLHFERWEDGDDWENGYKRHPLKHMNYSCSNNDVTVDVINQTGSNFDLEITTATNRLPVDKIKLNLLVTREREVETIEIDYSPPDPNVIPFLLNPMPMPVDYIYYQGIDLNCTYEVTPDYWNFGDEEYIITYSFFNFSRNHRSISSVYVQDPNDVQLAVWTGSSTNPEPEKIDKLINNYPNPIANSTRISYCLKSVSKNSKIEIYNVKGQKVKSLKLNNEPGKGNVNWDCTNISGNKVSPGVYLYKIINNDKLIGSKKMLVIDR